MPWLDNEHALDCEQAAIVLEFSAYLELLAGGATLERSAAALRALRPLGERDAIEARRERVRAWLRLLEDGLEPDLTGLREPGAWLEVSGRAGASLAGEQLRELATSLRALGRCGRFLAEHAAIAPVLQSDWGRPPDLGPLAETIERAVDEDGEIRDDASPLLARTRKRIRDTRDQVRGILETMIKQRQSEGGEEIRPRIRSGRMVLPVRRDARGSLAGIVHGESGSGRTLFVEPLETVDMNNRVSTLLSEEAEECARILRELTARVGQWSGEIRSRLDAFHRLDLPLAVARVTLHGKKSWAEWDDAGGLRLRAARHPLLESYLGEGERLIPLDLELAPSLRLLLVTGPNTGGKTVLLKTLGLMVLLNQCGLPLPAADGARLPLIGNLLVDIGDEQSIRDSRSTFSAHLEHLCRMVDEAGPDLLILVDEIGDGTDPEEGAALARAVMQRWIARGARAVVSTHFGVLKGFAQATAGAANASMDFDPVARKPLYSLNFGVPGSSRALATARRLGMDEEVLAEAEKLLGEEAMSLEALIERLERETQSAAAERGSAEALRARYEALAAEFESRMATVRQEEKRILGESKRRGEEFLSGARATIEAVVRDLREKDAERESILAAHERLATLQEGLQALAPAAPGRHGEDGGPLRDWRLGQRVRVRHTGQVGEILGEAGEGRLRVSVGTLSIVLSPDALSPAEGDKGEKPRPPAAPAVGYRVDAPESIRLDLRGMTVEEALEALDSFLDSAYLAEFPFVEIIHGKGTGALREAVTHALSRDGRVARQRLADQNQGGSGATVVELASGRPS